MRNGKGGKKGYQVKDRRSFTPEGEFKDRADGPAGVGDDSGDAGSVPPGPSPNGTPVGSSPPRPIDFGTFALSLATAALFHLGDAHEEGKKPPPANLPLARETIDILEMLQEKTRGNLSQDEATFLDGILFDLRMRYVAKTRAPVVA